MGSSAWVPVDETPVETSAWTPVDEAADAVPNEGLSAPAGAPDLGGLIQSDEAQARTAGLPGGTPNIQPATDTMAKVAGAGIGVGALVAAPAIASTVVGPIAGAATNYMAKNPIKSMIALEGAKHLPYVGKYAEKIPSWLPLLATGSGAAASEAEAGATAEAGTSVPVGKFTKERPNPPYTGPRVPDKMDLVDSTNVTKMGYHPDSKTMMVEYRNGRVYEYRGVPKEIYSQAKDAESVGSYISRQVKGRYETNYRGSVLGKK